MPRKKLKKKKTRSHRRPVDDFDDVMEQPQGEFTTNVTIEKSQNPMMPLGKNFAIENFDDRFRKGRS